MLPMQKTNPLFFEKPSFELNFWMKHFCGYSTEECREYEAFLDQPVVETMCFADTFDEDEYSDDLSIDYVEFLGPFVKQPKEEEDMILMIDEDGEVVMDEG